MSKQIQTLLIPVLVILLTACINISGEAPEKQLEENVEGQILIWHTWEGKERKVLQDLLEGFTDLYPDVTIAEEAYPLDDIEETFSYEVEAGLGPDILIAPANLTEPLAAQELIRDISDQEVDFDIYLTAAIDMLRSEENIYGLPLSLNTFALYYNKKLLGQPASSENVLAELIQERQALITNTQTISVLNELLTEIDQNKSTSKQFVSPDNLEALLQEANKGHSVAIRADFYGAFWGIKAFGGQLFDEKGRVVLNQGGFTNWLGWLEKAQDNPYIILNRNADVLTQLFTSGKAAYYVGSTSELPAFQAALGNEAVGVVRLPGRQNMPSGPVLQAEAIMFSKVSTQQSVEVALQLAQYLTHVEQQRQLALSLGKLPANKRVKIDPRVSPVVAEFIAQSRTAVPISLKNIQKFRDVLAYGDDLYGQVLEGEVNVADAAPKLTQRVNEKYGLETIAVNQTEDCTLEGSLTLWNTWNGDKEAALSEILENFRQTCPNASIVKINVDPIEFYERYQDAIEAEQAPDIFTGTNQQIRRLGKEELILNLSNMVDSDFLQRFIPLVGPSMLYQENIFGIPAGANAMALYYNTSMVDDPPVVLNDLLTAATPESQVAIPIGFKDSFWGIAAFSESGESTLFDQEKRLVIGKQGLSAWLEWLKAAQNQPGMVLSTEKTELEKLFIEEKAAFLVGDTLQLSRLQAALGSEKVGVVPVPSGSPLLYVDTLFISPFTTPKERELALHLARFTTDVENQLTMVEQGHKIPVNTNVDMAEYPAIEGFSQQANAATVIPNIPEADAVFEWGDLVYDQVLENDIIPTDATRDFANLVDATNGFEVAEQVAEETCTDEGEVSLWHSWTDTEQMIWQQVISNFVRLCPNVQITTTFISTADFTRQLTATLEADSKLSPPDFFIAPHANLETFHTNALVKDISNKVDKETLADYLPKSVTAVSIGDELFGIPQALYLPALYYHPDEVEEPANTFKDLLGQARLGATVAMNPGFPESFWGGAPFGCLACQTGQFLDEAGEPLLTPSEMANWLAWLESAAETGNFIFSADQPALEKMFLNEKVDYLVTGPDFLSEAQDTLGIANVALSPLPIGNEEQISRPFMHVDAFYFYRETTEEQTELAIKFAKFAAQEANQTLLMQGANFVPINSLAIATADDPAIVTFISQVETSIPLPKQSTLAVLKKNNLHTRFEALTAKKH